jgi:hypothetical protein
MLRIAVRHSSSLITPSNTMNKVLALLLAAASLALASCECCQVAKVPACCGPKKGCCDVAHR